MKKVIRFVINFILISIFIFSSYKVCSKLIEYRKADDIYSSIQDFKNDNLSDKNSTKESLKEKSKELINLNKDYQGWINVDGTKIDYPIVKGEDNDFYLDRDFYRNYLASGSIFLDYRNEFLKDENTIIYGHHMRNKTMFGGLADFKDEDFFDKNRFVHISDHKGNEYKFEIFSVYVVDGDFNYIIPRFDSDASYGEFIDGCVDRSMFDAGVDVGVDDKIVTLSTCSYEFDNARTVVHGRLIK